jgi:glutathione S-transferase
MPAIPRVTLFHAPNSRSTGALTLMEELDVPYDLEVLDLKKNQQREAKYLAVNPMGKVPAVLHNGALITEQPAVYLYLADLYPEANLAPRIGDSLRGPYLRWMVYYGSSFEPAIVDRSMKREPAPPSTSPYGDFDTMLNTLTGQLSKGAYMLGDSFTAVDVLWGVALAWITKFNLVPALPAIQSYVDRTNARPAFARAREKDQALAAKQA